MLDVDAKLSRFAGKGLEILLKVSRDEKMRLCLVKEEDDWMSSSNLDDAGRSDGRDGTYERRDTIAVSLVGCQVWSFCFCCLPRCLPLST